MSCILLVDPVHRVELQTFSQPTPVPAEYILKAQDRTTSDYPLRWSGLSVSIGQVVEESIPHIGHADWQNALAGVSRRESILLAAKSLAYMYKQRLPTSFISWMGVTPSSGELFICTVYNGVKVEPNDSCCKKRTCDTEIYIGISSCLTLLPNFLRNQLPVYLGFLFSGTLLFIV